MITVRIPVFAIFMLLGMLMLLLIGSQLPDIRRYLRMRNM
ncbi:hypothetical protein KDW_52800 [Dictyobacter vulcani]|uniref:Uncharacterized protein n=1 Tax=Dictyobacter vulcani TaxID=2607529 RepID=A0A5J4KN69_9CHLR|nr:hypothetical protein KDW_52800 [Dictyobacter vulcani]